MILLVNGPNLNLLGEREPAVYGSTTLQDVERMVSEACAAYGHEVKVFQSNHEGALIDRLHLRDFDWAVVNAAGLTHTSISLRDALKGIGRPFVEVHISDPGEREPFRHVNYLNDIAAERIVGKGVAGYAMALDFIAGRTGRRTAR